MVSSAGVQLRRSRAAAWLVHSSFEGALSIFAVFAEEGRMCQFLRLSIADVISDTWFDSSSHFLPDRNNTNLSRAEGARLGPGRAWAGGVIASEHLKPAAAACA